MFRKLIAASLLLCSAPVSAPAQSAPYFMAGADVSYLREMESKGIVFTDGGVPKPGLQILKDHGYNWVRLRIMNEPSPLPNTLVYTLASAKAAKALGFRILLDFHYSDDWADPAHNRVPKAWAKMPHDELVKAVFNFSRDTVTTMRQQGTMPDMVQVGNEITNGMLWPDGQLPERWEQFSELLTAGVRGVEAGKGTMPRPAIMIHIDQGGNMETTKWFFDHLIVNHVPFDVIGQSYYPWWQGSFDDLRKNLAFEIARYNKPVIVVETAYDWRDGEEFKGKKIPFPEAPEGQRDFLAALVDVVKQAPGNKGKGVFWWEPMAEGAIAKRGLFDDQHRALPAVHVFDTPTIPEPGALK